MALSFCGKRILLGKPLGVSSKRLQHGYIILVPEIGEESPEKSPFFRNDGLPEFNNITIENCRAAVAKQTLDFEAGVKQIAKNLTLKPCDNVFDEVFKPLEELGTSLEKTWGLSKTLYLGNSTLMPTSSYMSIHDRARRARVTKYNNKEIYDAVKTELETDRERSGEENRLLRKFFIEGKLNGLELDSHGVIILSGYLNKLAQEKTIFKQKTEVSTKAFFHTITDNNIIREFPDKLVKAICSDPNNPLKGPWKVTLAPHVYMPVMRYCPDPQVRWNLWQALVGRGSAYRDRELKTSLNLEEIRFIRRDIAKLLNYDSYAAMSMETKMAGSVSKVQDTLHGLLQSARPAQEEELKNLHQFASERGFKSSKLELWDVPYWRRKQLKSLYDYEEETFKEYFPLPKVLEGLIQLCEKLFNIVIKQRHNVSTWHRDVRFYDIFENYSSAPVAGFYLDPYARSEEKIRIESNGWMVGIQNHSRIANTKPLAALIFNFDAPTPEKDSYLTFTEVKSLFYKFGHAMQHLLTRTDYAELAGLSNVEWDAVEISGNVLAHWLYNKNVIDSISCHCNSGDTLPQQKFQTLLAVHKHMAGLDLSRELYLSALDLELHLTKDFWLDIIKRLWPQYRCFKLHKIDSHPLSFTQIVSEEWGAAYFSHVWARMIAADVYSAFHEVQGDEQQILDVGKRFRDTFLALGGSVHPSQVFREFRGRDPSPKALLSSLGLKKVSSKKPI
ncbi:probable cytosolic oligopeptidase A [Anoplophora glabripennis]|uniref:probable cytosolic oligopeptidase A n=1 Tax=Anoplophora glabripennis TaxID=217634 RepID=UPI0008756DBC|nr:probable cytosolic oligopeptidase A [Anoplophora glabripennis]